jgi:hypothetical protein
MRGPGCLPSWDLLAQAEEGAGIQGVHVADAGDAVGQVERQEGRAGGVYMHVPEAGDEVLPLAVHDPGPLRHLDLAGFADGRDPVAGDDDRPVQSGRRQFC